LPCPPTCASVRPGGRHGRQQPREEHRDLPRRHQQQAAGGGEHQRGPPLRPARPVRPGQAGRLLRPRGRHLRLAGGLDPPCAHAVPLGRAGLRRGAAAEPRGGLHLADARPPARRPGLRARLQPRRLHRPRAHRDARGLRHPPARGGEPGAVRRRGVREAGAQQEHRGLGAAARVRAHLRPPGGRPQGPRDGALRRPLGHREGRGNAVAPAEVAVDPAAAPCPHRPPRRRDRRAAAALPRVPRQRPRPRPPGADRAGPARGVVRRGPLRRRGDVPRRRAAVGHPAQVDGRGGDRRRAAGAAQGVRRRGAGRGRRGDR